MTLKVVVVGGGVIGLMQARELALTGCEVILIERGACGRESSWAGGGILSPLYPWRYPDAINVLAEWSQRYYPNLVESLEAESGVSAELLRHGMLYLSLDDQAAAFEWACERPLIEALEKRQVYALEPKLREGFQTAVYMPAVGSIRNPRLLKALRQSLRGFNTVSLLEHREVQRVLVTNGAVTGVAFHRISRDNKLQAVEEVKADAVVIAAGAWSPGLLDALLIELPVYPVKGQMLLLSGPQSPVQRIVMREDNYLIPRRDGKILVGSTMEHTGFNRMTSQKAKAQLMDCAVDLFPELHQSTIEAHWAGLRPGSDDGIPFIGEVPGVSGLFLNTGHFRNGLTLAPASVALLTAQLLDKPRPFSERPYSPESRLQPLADA